MTWGGDGCTRHLYVLFIIVTTMVSGSFELRAITAERTLILRKMDSKCIRNVSVVENKQRYNPFGERFQDIFSDGKTLTLSPACCVPYIRIRKMSESGVRRLMPSFQDKCSDDSLYARVSAVRSLPMVIPLLGAEECYPMKYFIECMRYSESDADAEVSKFSSWFGIIGGCHRNESLRRLILQNPPSFSSFTWTVLVLRPAPTPTLRAFARNILEKQSSFYRISATLYDI